MGEREGGSNKEPDKPKAPNQEISDGGKAEIHKLQEYKHLPQMTTETIVFKDGTELLITFPAYPSFRVQSKSVPNIDDTTFEPRPEIASEEGARHSSSSGLRTGGTFGGNGPFPDFLRQYKRTSQDAKAE